jgi:hypothetical protein
MSTPAKTKEAAPMTDNDESSPKELDRYGIVRVPADTFTWNGYKYTHLRDALAAAKRAEPK